MAGRLSLYAEATTSMGLFHGFVVAVVILERLMVELQHWGALTGCGWQHTSRFKAYHL